MTTYFSKVKDASLNAVRGAKQGLHILATAANDAKSVAFEGNLFGDEPESKGMFLQRFREIFSLLDALALFPNGNFAFN